MSIVIQISNLSKIYLLGEIGTGTLSHDLNRRQVEEEVSSKKYVVSSTPSIAFSSLEF